MCTGASRQEKQVQQLFVSLATSLQRGKQDLSAFLIGGNSQDHLQQLSDLFHLHLTGWSQFFLELDEAGALLPGVKGEDLIPSSSEALGSFRASHRPSQENKTRLEYPPSKEGNRLCHS